jgi:hypothetical protein
VGTAGERVETRRRKEMYISGWVRWSLMGFLSIVTMQLAGSAFAAEHVTGQVTIGGVPLAKSTVTLWEASANAPNKVAETKTNDDGRFDVRVSAHSDTILYLITTGGALKDKGDNPSLVLLLVLGNKPPERVAVNELTTVASAFTSAQFINGDSISGNPLGLRIAAGNVPNLVDTATGEWGKVIVDPLNSFQTTTLANLNTLGSLISAMPPRPTTPGAPGSSRPQPHPAE